MSEHCAFMSAMAAGDEVCGVPETLLSIARQLGIGAVVQYAETATQRDLLHRLGCASGHGNFFARPMPWHIASMAAERAWT